METMRALRVRRGGLVAVLIHKTPAGSKSPFNSWLPQSFSTISGLQDRSPPSPLGGSNQAMGFTIRKNGSILSY